MTVRIYTLSKGGVNPNKLYWITQWVQETNSRSWLWQLMDGRRMLMKDFVLQMVMVVSPVEHTPHYCGGVW